jgi:glycerate kinase
MADGGEGTVDAFVESGWTRVACAVRGPHGHLVDATFAYSDAAATAVVEMAAASGLALVPAERRDPLRATTFGTGELIRAALDRGARRIVVAIGGSATNDGGAGMLAALGVALHDADGRELDPGGAALALLARVDPGGLDPRVRATRFEIAADVDNPLLGPHGATHVFGPQKGATPSDVGALEAALARFADHTAGALGTDVRDEQGTGAAGGLGFGLRAYLDATVRPGVDLVADLRGLREALRGAAWCFTGEGAIDGQTLAGKTVAGVGALAAAAGARTVAFAGRVDAAAERALAARGIIAIPISDGPLDLSAATARASELLQRAAERTARLLRP